MVFDPTVTDWTSSSALKHSWAPSASNGFTTPTDGWGLPADVKLRNLKGSQYIVVGDTDGFAGVIPYPALTGKLWATNIGSAAGVHGIELMPDGNVAVAAATPAGSVSTLPRREPTTVFNRVILIGRLGQIPEVKIAQNSYDVMPRPPVNFERHLSRKASIYCSKPRTPTFRSQTAPNRTGKRMKRHLAQSSRME